MRYALYHLSSLFYFCRYLVTLMAPSLYLLQDIVYSLISTLLYLHIYKKHAATHAYSRTWLVYRDAFATEADCYNMVRTPTL